MATKKYGPVALIATFCVSFVAWCYCIAPGVLGLIYQAYPGQENVAVLIGTLPTVVTMIVAFASTVIFRFVPRKWMAIVSMIIALICGLMILMVEMPLVGVIACSALLGIPAGIIPAACATTCTISSSYKLKDKVVGWHNALMMLGMAVFQLLAGVFSKGGDFRDGYKSIFILIPVIIVAILLMPNVDKDMKHVVAMQDAAATANVGSAKPVKEKNSLVLFRIRTYLSSRMYILERLVHQLFRLCNQRSSHRRLSSCRSNWIIQLNRRNNRRILRCLVD